MYKTESRGKCCTSHRCVSNRCVMLVSLKRWNSSLNLHSIDTQQFSSRYRYTSQEDLSLSELRSRPPMYKRCVRSSWIRCLEMFRVYIGHHVLCRCSHRLMELMVSQTRTSRSTCQRVMRGHLAREFKRRMLATQKQLVRAIKKA